MTTRTVNEYVKLPYTVAAPHSLYPLPNRQYAQVAEQSAATTQGDPP